MTSNKPSPPQAGGVLGALLKELSKTIACGAIYAPQGAGY